MVEWHPWLNGHEFGYTLGVGDGQGGLACCGSGVAKSWTRLSNWTECCKNLYKSRLCHVTCIKIRINVYFSLYIDFKTYLIHCCILFHSFILPFKCKLVFPLLFLSGIEFLFYLPLLSTLLTWVMFGVKDAMVEGEKLKS